MSRPGLSRRAFLQGAGLGAAAYLAPWLRQGSAQAQSMTPPRRLVLFYVGGTGGTGTSLPDVWAPVAPAGMSAPTETQFDLGVLHRDNSSGPVMSDVKNDLIFLDGMDMYSAAIDPSPAGNAHAVGSTHALTGANRLGRFTPGGISIDQFVANQIDAGGPQTFLRSLEVLVRPDGGDGTGYTDANSYGGGSGVPVIGNPREVYGRLFPANAGLVRQRTVLDLVQRRFSAFDARFGGADRARLEQHAQLVRDLEARLAIAHAGPDALLDAPTATLLGGTNNIAYNYAQVADLQTRLVTAALAGDLTRVVTMVVDAPDNGSIHLAMPFPEGAGDAHGLSHLVPSNGTPESDPGVRARLLELHTLHARLFGNLVRSLKSVREPDGSTLLDHTAVLFCGQIATGCHQVTRLPWILAGSCGGYFRTGRYLKYAPVSGHGVPHNNLFVSLANAFGSSVTTFGNPRACTGPLDGLH